MGKKKKKAKKLLRKSADSFGVVFLDHVDPPLKVENRTPIRLGMSLDEGLKLHLALLQALSELNRLDRRSARSRARGISLAIFPEQNRLMVGHGDIKDNTAPR